MNDQMKIPTMKSSKTPPKYYDHDQEWLIRKNREYPIWGRNADINYQLALRHLEPHLGLIDDVLDVGCGAGRFGLHLSEAGLNYQGVDASTVAIELGLKHYPQLKLEVVDAATPHDQDPIPAKFTLVTSLNALHCMTTEEDRKHFWNFCWQHVAAGGFLYLTTMGGPTAPGARSSGTPRIYQTESALLAEVDGFDGTILWRQWSPVHQKNPIPNWYVLIQKHSNS